MTSPPDEQEGPDAPLATRLTECILGEPVIVVHILREIRDARTSRVDKTSMHRLLQCDAEGGIEGRSPRSMVHDVQPTIACSELAVN